MADPNKDRFLERLESIETKTKPGARIERRVNEDGLVVDVVSEKKSGRRSLIPYKTILVAALLGVLVKGFLLADLGEEAYLNQIEEMRDGTAGEIAAAFLLDADPATRAVARVFEAILN